MSQRLDRWIDPAVVFAALYRDETTAFWLDSADGAGTSYIGAVAESMPPTATPAVPLPPTAAPAVPVTGPALPAVLRGSAALDLLRASQQSLPDLDVDPLLPAFRLGWLGWLGYDPDESRFMFVDRMLAFDHAARTVTLLALESPSALALESPGALALESPSALALESPSAAEWLASTAATLSALIFASPAPIERAKSSAFTAIPEKSRPIEVPVKPLVRWRHGEEQYLRLIEECQEAIAAGEAYQLCLTNRIDIDVYPDPFETYLRLRQVNPSHHGAFIRFADVALLSASPERFLEVTPGGTVTTRPIKGTRPRGETAERDAVLKAELLGSVKERAENVMIVDLMRNDLARVAETGSVRVESLFQVESYASVHQLVSTVTARLAAGSTAIDAIEVCFPAGSMTGAPKISAMSILRRLEGGSRGIYAGAFGYLGLDGRVDLAMSIRSIVLGPEGASIGTGGGITALSIPAEEVAETRIKAAPLLEALGVSAEGELVADTLLSIV